MSTLGWGGTLAEQPHTETTQHGASEIVPAALAMQQGHGPEALLDTLRGSVLLVETEHGEDGYTVATMSAEPGGLWWLPVFSEQQQLADYALRGQRGDTSITYGQLSGAEVFDELLVQLPRGTGVLLDPAAEHTVALPPVPGIVPAAIALDPDVHGDTSDG
ncbi:SseB family protein [Actinopolyspora halophila]|uniref:SseB family protein n=1 Tax=Actinopolyspora halophila TaxID=1850 RepID=UPI000372C0AF|nr:SseB family protein [Actinopolyspora halophila]